MAYNYLICIDVFFAFFGQNFGHGVGGGEGHESHSYGVTDHFPVRTQGFSYLAEAVCNIRVNT